jgi:hypothetical protein
VEDGYREPPEFFSAHVGLPTDGTFEDGAPLLDALAGHFGQTQVTRAHRDAGLGGAGIEIGFFDLVIYGSLLSGGIFAKKFLERLADDAYAELRRKLIGFARHRTERRGVGSELRVHVVDDPSEEHPRYVAFTWVSTTEDDLLRLSRAAARLPASLMRRRENRFRWDPRREAWTRYSWEPYRDIGERDDEERQR